MKYAFFFEKWSSSFKIPEIQEVLSGIQILMNSHVHRYYRKFVDEEMPVRLFHEVFALHDDPSISWSELSDRVPSLPKGWYELAHLKREDRIEFVCEFWLNTLPFIPHVHEFLKTFFRSLDDIGVFVYQWRVENPFECEMVYSLRDGSCFYHGKPFCHDEEIAYLNHHYGEMLPPDYLAFLKIHNGFGKHTDTGLIRAEEIPILHNQTVAQTSEKNIVISCHGQMIDPKDLIPFYESFGRRSYQCFYKGWYPDIEMGNVYFSPREKIISDFQKQNALQDNLAFPSFLDWLIFYLESIG